MSLLLGSLERTGDRVGEFSRRHAAGIRLFLLVFLTLYLELALIRYTSAEVRYLGYFSNFVLISAFLGTGAGFLATHKRVRLFGLLPLLVLALLVFVMAAKLDVSDLRDNAGQLFFGHSSREQPLAMYLGLAVIFALCALCFASIAQETGRCFKHYSPLVAYSLDIGGGLAGILAFTLQAYLRATPLAWFVPAWLLIIYLVGTPRLRVLAGVTGLVAGALLMTGGGARAPYSRWSPYQRVNVRPNGNGYLLSVNRIPHQTMAPVGSKEPIYDFPYREVQRRRGGRPYERALVIGSGAGTDVSYALAYGVKQVDAVEIDPEILAAGKLFHPARPYGDPRVARHVDDGRAYMERTDHRYDLIIYALPDSLAAYSNLANIRLESFLFTLESFARARDLLTPDGVLVLYNYYRKQWLVDKLAAMLKEVFGHEPLIEVLADERYGMLAALAIGQKLIGPAVRRDKEVALATDTWPFLYMQTREMPPYYVLVMLLFLGCGLLTVRLTGNATLSDLRTNGPFLLMGAAFLLLETKSVIEFSLLFGATWLVNALVFFAVLLSVLLANLVVAKTKPRTPWIPFLLLFVALGISVALPLRELLGINNVFWRYVASSAVVFSPVFCANLVFGTLFRGVEQTPIAFGWNLIGTMIGAALEYTSIVLGYDVLGYLVAALYATTALWAWLATRVHFVAPLQATRLAQE